MFLNTTYEARHCQYALIMHTLRHKPLPHVNTISHSFYPGDQIYKCKIFIIFYRQLKIKYLFDNQYNKVIFFSSRLVLFSLAQNLMKIISKKKKKNLENESFVVLDIVG